MAYGETMTPGRKIGSMAAVGVIHAGMGLALVIGLSYEKIIETVNNPDGIFVDDVPLDPPPPQPDENTADPTEATRPIHAPTPPIDLMRDPVNIETTPAQLPPIDDIILDPLPPSTYVTPKPTPSPGLDPVAARPRNDPAGWVTTNDYPGRAIHEEWEGTTSFKVTVGTDGRAQNCTVTRSSGHAVLDNATCRNVMKRARFNSAMDGFGEKAMGSYSGSVRWQLPD